MQFWKQKRSYDRGIVSLNRLYLIETVKFSTYTNWQVSEKRLCTFQFVLI